MRKTLEKKERGIEGERKKWKESEGERKKWEESEEEGIKSWKQVENQSGGKGVRFLYKRK